MLALVILLSGCMWADHVHAHPSASRADCSGWADHAHLEIQRPQPMGHGTLADGIYLEPAVVECSEDQDLLHDLARERQSSGLVRSQIERHEKQPPELMYREPKRYLSLQSFLC